VPGLVDQKTGSLLFAPNLGWRDVPLADFLRAHFDAPIFIDNEANMAALGEHYSGAAQGCDEMLYISVGVGLGGGIVRNGALFRGTSGFAGEFGHMTIVPGGLPCNCGSRGCWETVVSQSALYRTIRESIEGGACSVLTETASSNLSRLTIEQIVDAANKGDAVTLNALNTLAHYLSIGIVSLVNAFDPELVVVGGILSQAADFLLPAVEARLRERSLSGNSTPTRVVKARHGFSACIMGGVATVVTGILAQPGNAVR
jgi:glucokinase-like ROK family protein